MEVKNFDETLPNIVWDSVGYKVSSDKYIYYLPDLKKICQKRMDDFYNIAKMNLPFRDYNFYVNNEIKATYFLRDILKKINIPKEEICHLSVLKIDYNTCIINCYLENSNENIEINILADKNNSIKLEVIHHNIHYKYDINDYTENNENNLQLYNIRKYFIDKKFLDCSILGKRVKIRSGYAEYNDMSERDDIYYTFTLDINDDKAIKLFYNKKITNILVNLKTFEFEIIDVFKQLMDIFNEENLTFTDISLINENEEEYYSSLILEYICFKNGKLYMAKIRKGDATYKINSDGTWEYISPTLKVSLDNSANYKLGEQRNMQVLENEIQKIKPFLNLDFEEKGITKKLKN